MSDYCENFYRLQIELSTVCNALCLGCVRTDTYNYNRVKSFIPKNKYLDTDVLLRMLQSSSGARIRMLEFCGNIDEPLAHPQFAELIDQLSQTRPDLAVSIHTNGGLGDPEKFSRIAKAMTKFQPRSNFRFSIDGLEDTNHIYRQRVKWHKVMANLEACVQQGARVIWQYLVFPWNEHQVAEAQALAKQMGCEEFWVRPDRSGATKEGLERIRIRQQQNVSAKRRSKGSISAYRSFVQLKNQPIDCSFKEMGMLFLSWEGKIWPCCFISNIFYESESKIRMFEKYVVGKYEKNFNSIYERSLEEILNHPLYTNDLVESWSDNTSKSRAKWRCVEKCSAAKVRSSDGQLDDKAHFAHISLTSES